MIEIKKMDINGNGIGYKNRKVVFVKKALPGEVVKAHIRKEYSNYMEADLEFVAKKSPHRVRPKCPIYEDCGGCNLMHYRYKKQLEYKRNIVADSIKKYVNIPLKVNPTIGLEHPFGYRNKAQLRVKKTKKVLLGLFEEFSNFVVDIENCPVHRSEVNETVKKLKGILENTSLTLGRDGIHRVLIRVNDEDTTVVFVSAKAMDLSKLVTDCKVIPNLNIFSSVTDKRQFLGETKCLYGKETSIRSIGDVTFEVRPTDFFQLNDIQTVQMYDYIKNLTKDSTSIVDCYMGVGTIGQYIVDNQELRGIDIVPSSVISAKENAKRNGIEAKYSMGSVSEILPKWAKKGYRPDTMIFDPPRTGIGDDIETILKMKPKQIVYVSCNPSTLAKDLKRLKDHFVIQSIQPFDMFPQTSHVETVTLLTRK